MVDAGIDDQCHHLRLITDVLVSIEAKVVGQFDAMLTLGVEPAALKSLRCDDYVFSFCGGELEVLVHGFFGETTDDPGRDQDDQCKHDKQDNDTFFHDEPPFAKHRAWDASMQKPAVSLDLN